MFEFDPLPLDDDYPDSSDISDETLDALDGFDPDGYTEQEYRDLMDRI